MLNLDELCDSPPVKPLNRVYLPSGGRTAALS